MSLVAQVHIHPSQFPAQVRRDLVESLRRRQVNHKFLYDGVKQTQKWLALHQAFSPSRTDPDCAVIYDGSFEAAAQSMRSRSVQLIGLGCGGGQKDARLLALLRDAGKQTSYVPVDVSTPMVLVAREAALEVNQKDECLPLVVDLATAADLDAVIGSFAKPRQVRLITFFGMIPNFEPDHVLPQLARLVRPGDLLLFSANLAPGKDYRKGVEQILPLYDNELTRDWLMGFLTDLGVEKRDGEIRFVIEEEAGNSGLKRIVAHYEFQASRAIHLDDEVFTFDRGDKIRLFFSYRHTPAMVKNMIGEHGLKVLELWIAKSGEEGVFLADRDLVQNS
jgi:uncharacterized SAM-dependent methyltransferase